MDLEITSRELLVAIRHPLSQADISTKLGFRHNQYYRWETGKSGMYWDDFVRLCEVCQISLDSTFNQYLQSRDLDGLSLVKLVTKMTSTRELSDLLQRSQDSTYRLLNGQTVPKLADMLLLLYRCTNFLPELLADLVGADSLPSIQSELELRAKERNFQYQFPLFSALVRCFEMADYENSNQHDDHLVASFLGVNVEEAKKLITQAADLGLIALQENKYRILNKSLTTAGDLKGQKGILEYWQNRASSIIGKNLTAGQLDARYLVFATNDATFKKIIKLTSEYHTALFTLLHHDENRTGHEPLDRIVALTQTLENLSGGRLEKAD